MVLAALVQRVMEVLPRSGQAIYLFQGIGRFAHSGHDQKQFFFAALRRYNVSQILQCNGIFYRSATKLKYFHQLRLLLRKCKYPSVMFQNIIFL
ncbi:hypothetical protein O71_08872 [Pontibacter sp. BAB1700]|nr:hypothetical protein O71_08872 [Pontibacter sp. BAB1700]